MNQLETSPTSEVLCTRYTSDGLMVDLWDDGLLTFGLGARIAGVGVSRDAGKQTRHVAAGWMVMTRLKEWTSADVPRLVKTARKLMEGSGPVYPSDLDEAMRPKPVKPAPVRPKRCTACRYGVGGWQRCNYHEAEHIRRERGF